MVNDRFRLRYKLTPKDYQNYAKLAGKRAKGSTTLRMFFSMLIVGIVIGLLLGTLKNAGLLTHGESRAALAGMAVGAILCFLTLFIALKFVGANRLVGDHDAVVGDFTLVAYDGGGIQITGVHASSSYNWTAFTDVTQAPDLVMLWVDRGAAEVLPISAFADEDEKQQFVDFVNERIEAHRQAG